MFQRLICSLSTLLQEKPLLAAPTSLVEKNVEAGPVETAIAGYVGTLINDGDTLQIGVLALPANGVLAWTLLRVKSELGWHSEATPKGVIKMMREGQITGKYKTINKDKHICTA